MILVSSDLNYFQKINGWGSYYTSPLFAKDIDYLVYAGFASVDYSVATDTDWTKVADPGYGLVLYADEILNATDKVSNYTNLIYIPPTTPTDEPTETYITRCDLIRDVIGAAGISLMTGTDLSFADLPATNVCYKYAYTAVKNGLINTYYNGTFGPQDTLTRAQVIKVVVDAFGLPSFTPNAQTFPDVSSGEWYYSYVETAAHFGLIEAQPNGQFNPAGNASVDWVGGVLAKASAL